MATQLHTALAGLPPPLHSACQNRDYHSNKPLTQLFARNLACLRRHFDWRMILSRKLCSPATVSSQKCSLGLAAATAAKRFKHIKIGEAGLLEARRQPLVSIQGWTPLKTCASSIGSIRLRACGLGRQFRRQEYSASQLWVVIITAIASALSGLGARKTKGKDLSAVPRRSPLALRLHLISDTNHRTVQLTAAAAGVCT